MPDFENSKNDLKALQSAALHLWEADKKSAKELGAALDKVRRAMRAVKYGTFGEWLKEHGIPQNRASYAMRVANGKQEKAAKKSKLTPKPIEATYTLTPELNSAVVSLARAWDTKPSNLVSEILAEYVRVYAQEVARGRTPSAPLKLEKPLTRGSVAVNTTELKHVLKCLWGVIRADDRAFGKSSLSKSNVRFFKDADGVNLEVSEPTDDDKAPSSWQRYTFEEASANGTVNLNLAFKEFQALMHERPDDGITTIEPNEHGTTVKYKRGRVVLPALAADRDKLISANKYDESAGYLFSDDPFYCDNWASSGMPDYVSNNLKPHKSLRVHFKNEGNVQEFAKLVGQKVMEKTRSLWFPDTEICHAADKGYVVEGKACNPEYPVYIISKGRWEKRHTAKSLDAMGVPYHIVIEPQEYDKYAAVIDRKKILTLPVDFREKAPRGDAGSIPARNWVWEHSKSLGAERHWILDDNIDGFYRLNNNVKIRVLTGAPFKAAEDFVNQFENVGLAGFNYFMFAKASDKLPAFYLNTRIYSCILIKNDLPFHWRGKYNEDTDLSLRILKGRLCTVLFNTFLCDKLTTMTTKGGNTDELYQGDGRRKMMLSLKEQHPNLVKLSFKFGHPQHHVNYGDFFRQRLERRADAGCLPTNNYRMVLKTVSAKAKAATAN